MAQKKITDLTLRTDFDATCNVPVDDPAQTWRATGQMIRNFIAPLTTLGDILFASTSGVAARLAGNTSETMKVLTQTGTGAASAAPAWREFKAPTIQTFTSGSGTYTTPAGVMYIRVRMVASGGSGGGGGTNSTLTAGTNGNNSTFGTSLLTANAGSGATGGPGGSGAGGTINSPAVGSVVLGGTGGFGVTVTGYAIGGAGGGGVLGGAGACGGPGAAGGAGRNNTGGGGGGGGGGTGATANGGSGGGSGGFIDAIIPNPSASYAYSVGASVSGGAAGSGGGAGGASGSGYIEVTEYYQ